MSLSLKQVGNEVRVRLRKAQQSGRIPDENPADHFDSVRYEVRVSNGKNGPKVNVTIGSYNWLIPDVENATPADMKRWGDTAGAAIITTVDEVIGRADYTEPDGTEIGGETKFGPCIVITSTTARRETN